MLQVTRLVRAEIARHDWSRLRCGCQESGEHLPELLERLLSAEDLADLRGSSLEGHLELNTNLFEIAVPAVGVLLAGLAGPLSIPAREQALATLWYLVGGESHRSEAERGRTRLGDECRLKAREGLWVILHHALNGRDETASEILGLIDLDEERAGYFAAAVSRRR